MVFFQDNVGLQAGRKRRVAGIGSSEKYEQNLSELRIYFGKNRQTQAHFSECTKCGYKENADVVGAINVLRAGHARLACEMNGAVRPLSAGTQRDLLQQ